jgi:diguanylate cyclase (GGDEF)-like protein
MFLIFLARQKVWFHFQKFWKTITTPRSQDETQARREYMIRVTLFSMTGLLFLFTLLIFLGYLTGWFVLADVAIMLAITLPVLAGWLMTLAGRWRIAGVIPPLVFLALGTYGSVGGLVSNFVLAYAIAIVLTGILVEQKYAWLMVLISLVLHLGLGYQAEPVDFLELFVVGIPVAGFLIGIAVMQHFASNVLQDALIHLRDGAEKMQQEIRDRELVENELRQRNRELTLLNRVVAASNSTLDLYDALRTTLEALVTGLNMDMGAVALLEPAHNHLRIVAEYPVCDETSVVGAIIPVADNPSTQYVMSNRQALAVTDAQNDPRMEAVHGLLRSRNVASILILPLIAHNQVIGTIGLDSSTRRVFMEDEITLAGNAALATAQAIENSRLYARIQNLAIHDELTGVLNRRGLYEFGRREQERARRFRRELAAIFLDIDLFKSVNDRLGHATGDFVLQQVANFICSNTREVDLVCRYGGDEFVVLLTETGLGRAMEVANRLCVDIHSRHILSGQNKLSISVSIGVAILSADMENLEALIECADDVMYQAKQAGRDQVRSNV